MQPSHQASCDLPPELCAKPQALVGVSGLDTLNNAIHKSIWEAFNSLRRTDKSSVAYKLVENDHEFPVLKPKRNSYDWYVPRGVLKKNWMRKQLHDVPAVVAIFHDLDWNDACWSEKMIECASRVQSMRAALEGRNTRILLVLIQNVLPLPPGEDAQATERAVSICASCELQSNSLFILPQGDHLHGYALRLESAFLEFAQNYYHNEIRNVKGHKEHLNKVTHQCLFVRHQFKLGFLYELKQDIHTAHKHYTYAYNSLLEMRIVDTNALEIRTIAGFICYKLCRLLFALNQPRDSINQFKSHVDKFRQRIGFQELGFEHFAWLSKQFAVFGDVFDSAVKLGITPVQTQHPGIYYQQAAEFAIMRKGFAAEVCSNVDGYPDVDPFDVKQHVDFYGQRPWRSGKSGVEPLDPEVESRGIQALQFLEKQVNHSNIIIGLYGLAIQQHKLYKCPRMRRYLVIQMADEYYKSGDYGKCSTLLMHMLHDMRCEKWFKLITDISVKALQCAYLTANIADYVSLSLELLGTDTAISLEEKKFIHDNMERIIQLQIPYGDSRLQHDILQNAIIHWQSAYNKVPVNIDLDMANIIPCVEAKAKFTKADFEMTEIVLISVVAKNTSPFKLNFSKITVSIDALDVTHELPVKETSLTFASEASRTFTVQFTPKHEHVHNILQINSVNFKLGDTKTCSINLKFPNPTSANGNLTELPLLNYIENMQNCGGPDPLMKTLIQPRRSKLTIKIDHNSPALQNEWYEMNINLTNEESCALENVKIELSIAEEQHIEGLEFSARPDGNVLKLPLVLKEIETLTKKTVDAKFYVRAKRVLQQTVSVNVSYVPADDPSLSCSQTEITTFEVIVPFQVTTKFMSNLMTELNSFHYGESFKVICVIESFSPWPLTFEGSNIEHNEYHVKPSNEAEAVAKIGTVVLNKGETYVEMFSFVPTNVSEQNITIGEYTMKWRRKDGYSGSNRLTIIGHPVWWFPLHLSVNVAAFGTVRHPLLIFYNVLNNSDQLIQLNVNMEASDAFMFAGYKQFTVSVLPKSVRVLQYNLYPLITGKVTLPKIVMKLVDDGEDSLMKQEELDALLSRTLPTSIYSIPQTKGNPPTQALKVDKKSVEVNVIEDL